MNFMVCVKFIHKNQIIYGSHLNYFGSIYEYFTLQKLLTIRYIFILCVAVWCLVYMGKSKPEGINSSTFDFCVLQNY